MTFLWKQNVSDMWANFFVMVRVSLEEILVLYDVNWFFFHTLNAYEAKKISLGIAGELRIVSSLFMNCAFIEMSNNFLKISISVIKWLFKYENCKDVMWESVFIGTTFLG